MFRSQSLPWQRSIHDRRISIQHHKMVGSLTRLGCAEERAPCGFEAMFYAVSWIRNSENSILSTHSGE